MSHSAFFCIDFPIFLLLRSSSFACFQPSFSFLSFTVHLILSLSFVSSCMFSQEIAGLRSQLDSTVRESDQLRHELASANAKVKATEDEMRQILKVSSKDFYCFLYPSCRFLCPTVIFLFLPVVFCLFD